MVAWCRGDGFGILCVLCACCWGVSSCLLDCSFAWFVCVCCDLCLFVSLFVYLVGGLFVSMCACLFFWHLGAHFGVLVALWKTLWRLSSTLGDLGAPFCHPWGSVVAPGGPFCHPWSTFGRLFVDLG